MSGAEVVVVLGAIASACTLIESCNKLRQSYTRLKEDKCAASLSSLIPKLELVKDTLSLLNTHMPESPQTDKLRTYLPNIESLIARIREHITVLESAASSNMLQSLSRRPKVAVALRTLKELENELMQWQVTIMTHMLVRHVTGPQQSATMSLAGPAAGGDLPHENLRKKLQQKPPCYRGSCACLCHQSRQQQRALIISAPSTLIVRCGCFKRDIAISISALKKIWTLQVSVDWTQGMKLSSSLQYQNTVKRTSPGFMIVEKCFYGQLNFHQARQAFTELESQGIIRFTDVTPDGYSMLESVMRQPWRPGCPELQWDLIDFLMRTGAPVDSERLLEISLTWVGEGPFISLIETLVSQPRQPLDAGNITPKLFCNWPRAASSDWILPYYSGDTFYLRTLSALIKSDCEFGGSTELHGAVLRNEKGHVESLSRRPDPLKDDRNFLGQSVLHLAVLGSDMMAHVINKFPDVDLDAHDNGGTTPLMYAMAYNDTKSSQQLLFAGADPFYRDRLNGFCAWDYALACANSELLQPCITAFSERRPDLAANAIGYCLWQRVVVRTARFKDYESETLQYLLKLEVALDAVSRCGNTLLHLCKPRERKFLLQHRTIPINQKNQRGYTPLMAFAQFPGEDQPELMKRAIVQGAVVDMIDNNGRNVLHHVTTEISAGQYWGTTDSSSWLSMMKSAAVLLWSGVELNGGDSCQCPCSSHGCKPLAYIFPIYHGSHSQIRDVEVIPWLVEWLILIRHFRPTTEVSSALIALYRRCQFDEIGMTHTCCRRRQPKMNFASESWSPLDDEIEYHRKASQECAGQEEIVEIISEQDIDSEEIRDEEAYYESQLDYACEQFYATALADLETAWIKLLARRAVMFEEILHDAQGKQDSRVVPHRFAQAATAKVYGEIITDSPLRYVNHEKDTIEEFYSPLDSRWLFNLEVKLEDCVDKYLAAFDEHPNYLDKVTECPIDGSEWRKQRSKLITQLLEEARRLRGAPKEERDWDPCLGDD